MQLRKLLHLLFLITVTAASSLQAETFSYSPNLDVGFATNQLLNSNRDLNYVTIRTEIQTKWNNVTLGPILGKSISSPSNMFLTVPVEYTWNWKSQLSLRVFTGPSYSDVGSNETCSKLNWQTGVTMGYKQVSLGYSHLSNGGIRSPNRGLDLVHVSARISF